MVIQEDRWKQAEFKRGARGEALDDLPWSEVFFVGVGASDVEVELVGVDFGEEIAAASEVFEIEELVFFEAMDGFDIALIGVGRGRNTDVLTVAERGGKITFEFAAVVGLPDQITERNAVAMEVLLNARSEHRAEGGAAFFGEGPEQETAADFSGGVLDEGQVQKLSLLPVARDIVEIFGIRADLLK